MRVPRVDDFNKQPGELGFSPAFRRFAELLEKQVAFSFSQREHKIVLAVRQLANEQRGAANITIQDLADVLHLSTSHLSRVFRRVRRIAEFATLGNFGHIETQI